MIIEDPDDNKFEFWRRHATSTSGAVGKRRESESHIGGPILSGWVGLGAKCDLNQIFGCRSTM